MKIILNVKKNKKKIVLIASVLNIILIFNANLMNANLDSINYEKLNQIHSPSLASTNDYDFFKEITILSSQVSGSGSHFNFPVLISLTDIDLRDQCQADGDDIAFYSGTTLLDYEIEHFNGATGKLVAWVRIPSLSTSTNTIIRMYYGNPTLGSSEENPTDVWNSNYKGIWHLSEDPTGTIYDSTVNNNDGISSGTMTSGDQVAGIVDGCLDFDGSNDNVNVGSGTSLSITNDITIEFWIRGHSWSSSPNIVTKGNNWDDSYCVDVYDDGLVDFWINGDYLESNQPLALNTWYHIACTRLSGTRSIYINGIMSGSDYNPDVFGTIGPVVFSMDGYMFDGLLDEIRISNNARNQNWIITEFNNQNNPGSFFTVGNAIINDFIHPTISILEPSLGLTLNGTILIVASASDNKGVTKVEFYIDNNLQFSDTSSPHEYNWDTTTHSNGTYEIKVIAYDAAGNTDEDIRSVNVENEKSSNNQLPLSPSSDIMILTLILSIGICSFVAMGIIGSIKHNSNTKPKPKKKTKYDKVQNSYKTRKSSPITNSCINDLLTIFCNDISNRYYSEPKLYSDIRKMSDGLIMNFGNFIQNRLVATEGLAELLNLDPYRIQHIKAIQFFFETDLSEMNLKKIILSYQTSDILNIIVGIHWPKFRYGPIIKTPHDGRLKYRENCKIIGPEVFMALIGLKGKHKINFEKIIGYSLDSKFKALKKFQTSHKTLPYYTKDLKDDLIRMGVIRNYANEYFNVW